METSETISKIAIALSKMQGALEGAKKDASNPFHKSKYANLESVWEACREQLAKNELAIVQAPSFLEGRMILITRLIHSSGEWFQSRLSLKPERGDTPQAIGSCITYAKRYALMAMVGIADTDDDDGNAASGKVVNQNSAYDPNNQKMREWLWGDIFLKAKIFDKSLQTKIAADATRDKIKLKDLPHYVMSTLGEK